MNTLLITTLYFGCLIYLVIGARKHCNFERASSIARRIDNGLNLGGSETSIAGLGDSRKRYNNVMAGNSAVRLFEISLLLFDFPSINLYHVLLSATSLLLALLVRTLHSHHLSGIYFSQGNTMCPTPSPTPCTATTWASPSSTPTSCCARTPTTMSRWGRGKGGGREKVLGRSKVIRL